MHEALDRCGAGAGGTRNISGTNHYHVLLERELADLHGKQAALLFTSGYVANETALATLARLLPGCIVFSDALNHASMIDGIRRERRGEAHLPPQRRRRISTSCWPRRRPARPKLIAFESVYSMDGDIAPIAAHLRPRRALRRHDLSRRGACRRACTAPRGGGVAERDGVMDRARRSSRARSARPSASWAATSPAPPRWSMRCAAPRPGFIFTTALPPVIAAGALASVRHLRQRAGAARASPGSGGAAEAPARRGRPAGDAEREPYRAGAGRRRRSSARRSATSCSQRHGIYVQPINYPTVPRGTERLRLTPSPLHDEAMALALVAALSDVWKRLGLKAAA